MERFYRTKGPGMYGSAYRGQLQSITAINSITAQPKAPVRLVPSAPTNGGVHLIVGSRYPSPQKNPNAQTPVLQNPVVLTDGVSCRHGEAPERRDHQPGAGHGQGGEHSVHVQLRGVLCGVARREERHKRGCISCSTSFRIVASGMGRSQAAASASERGVVPLAAREVSGDRV